ncbi:MAG: phosphonate ABC transporter ATP-binding protein, partial [Candidatus Riflebacteria bacterium]|nr:phosphonate ABC transporter ATP-binding protein [Candidatus Riflebacteria bacterium]
PVLYAHDGQNLFDPGLSFSDHDWKADEVATYLIQEDRVREFIIVAVANSSDRDDEYNMYRPLGKAYAEWFLRTLMPSINHRYRTLTGPKDTAVMGSSLGALISFQMAFNFPKVFSMAGCLSPAFWLSRSRAYHQVRNAPQMSRSTKYYLDAGDMEPEFADSCLRMTEILANKGFKEGKNLMCHIAEGANHSELAWSERVHLPFEFFFGK